jgi:uncharacterized protein (TIGR02466 family)
VPSNRAPPWQRQGRWLDGARPGVGHGAHPVHYMKSVSDGTAPRAEIIRLFPTFAWKARVEIGAREVIRRGVLEVLGTLRAGLADPAPGEVWQSRHGLHTLPALAPLVRQVQEGLGQVLAFLCVARTELELTGLWVNVAAPGAAMRLHAHPNNFLSGVYYVQVQPGAETINFHDPRPQTAIVRPPTTELTAYNTDQVVVPVEEGTLLVFPAWLAHSVDANQSDQLRVSVSFNAMFSSFGETMGEPLWGER